MGYKVLLVRVVQVYLKSSRLLNYHQSSHCCEAKQAKTECYMLYNKPEYWT